MKKFNLYKEIIITNTKELLNAVDSEKEFSINIKGKIIYQPTEKDILIYKGRCSKNKSIQDNFGTNYQIVEDDDRVLIKAFSNWQEIININISNASYDDTTSDGVSEFSYKDLEDIGWNATEFDIDYRELVETIEENVKGILLCIEQENPYHFSGLGFIDNNDEAKEILFNYVQNKIKNMMKEDPLYSVQNLTDDEKESAYFFNCI